MNNRCLIRIIKSELRNFKNVEYGQIKYMNYSPVTKDAILKNNDIVGIYGQNGSGKTAMVEALDILKCILSGVEISYELYAGLLRKDEATTISTSFFVQNNTDKYKVQYEATLQADHEEKKVNLVMEELTYWTRGATWKGKRNFQFLNPYYNSDSILENKDIYIKSSHIKYFKNINFIKSLQSVAVYCAQKHVSLFFNNLVLKERYSREESGEEVYALYDVMQGLFDFGRLYFQVVKVSQLGAINRKNVIPVNVHSESKNRILQGCLPLVMNSQGEIPETLFNQLQSAIEAINIALKAIIPKLQIELYTRSEDINKEGEKVRQVEVYSIRDGHRFLTKYESEGIKRIISLLNYLVSLYNYPEICLVVDELDSGIFEYLLGELLGVLYEDAKGQLIFTSHNLRTFEKIYYKNIICSTTNPQNRYIRLVGVEKNHNLRDFYYRTILLGGQQEELYDEVDLHSIGYAFRKANNQREKINLPFSKDLLKKLNQIEEH